MRAFLLVLSAVLSSASVLIVEIIAGRMLAPYVGMSVYSWTAIISTVLAGLSLGHWIGGRISTTDQRRAERTLIWTFAGGAALIVAVLILIRPVAGFVLESVGSPISGVLGIAALVFLPAACIGGIAAPVITRMAISGDRDKEGILLGRLYAAGALGAIGGSLAAGFVLIPYLGSAKSIIVAAALQAGLALTWALMTRRAAAAALSILLFLGSGMGSLALWRDSCDTESAYFCIRVVPIDTDSLATAEVRGLVLDHLVHGMNVRAAPQALLSPYLAQIHTTVRKLHSGPKRAFFVGGGAYTLPRLWAPYLDVTVAEIDPAVTEIAAQRLWVDPTAMTIQHRDARVVLRESADASFDVIIGDAFKDVAAPFHLVTQEFLSLVSRKLAPGGLYIMNLVDRGPDYDAVAALYRTFGNVFADSAAWQDTEEMETGGRGTFVLVGRKDGMISSAERRDASFQGWRPFIPVILKTTPVLTDDFAPLEHLLDLYSDSLD